MPDNGARGLIIAVGVLAVVVVFGLLAYLVINTPPPPPKPPIRGNGAASAELNIDVYLDGSQSIRQFLKGATPGQTNYLKSLLGDLETHLNSALGNHTSPGVEWSNGTVNYWKFGAFGHGQVNAGSQHPFAIHLDARELSTLANDPDKEFNATRTPIEKPIIDQQGGAYPSKLKVIITDLYQTGADTGTYANPLANQYLDNETKAVEVMAVRNPFAGVVDDLPGCGKLKEAADTMPFYVIVAGPVGDVQHAVEILKGAAGLSAAVADHRTQEWFFSKSPRALQTKEQEPIVRIRNARKQGHPWTELTDFQKSDYPKVVESEEQGLPALTMRKGEKAEVSWTMPLGVDGVTEETGLRPQVKVSRSKDRSGTGVEDVNAEAAVKMSCESHPEGKAGECFTIDESQLKEPANYLVDFDLIAPASGAYRPETLKPESASMRKWNIEVPDVQSVCRTGGAFPSRPGIAGNRAGMTPQLSQFLMALYEKKLNTPVRMATYSLYVKAR
jgi:hypothetical protein